MDETPLRLEDFLRAIIDRKGSDVYIVPGAKVMAKIGDQLEPLSDAKLRLSDCDELIHQIYARADNRPMERINRDGDDDFSFGLASMGRFRCNAFKQRGTLAAVLRVVPFQLPDAHALHIPDAVLDLGRLKHGMVLVTGPAGSGKTTTQACIIDRINQTRAGHIITLEDPIEYIHPHKQCLVTQREVENDTRDFAHALRAALRQAPDVILLGEMRDFETIQTALTAAETGHLLLSTLHTLGASKTIGRIVDVFPASQQQQVCLQLSMTLKAVVSQQLICGIDGGVVPVFEVMIVNSAIANLIRKNETQQIENAIYAGAADGMVAMDSEIQRLYREQRITREDALNAALNRDSLLRKLAN